MMSLGTLMTVYSCTGITVDRLQDMPMWELSEYLLASVKYLGLDKKKSRS